MYLWEHTRQCVPTVCGSANLLLLALAAGEEQVPAVGQACRANTGYVLTLPLRRWISCSSNCTGAAQPPNLALPNRYFSLLFHSQMLNLCLLTLLFAFWTFFGRLWCAPVSRPQGCVENEAGDWWTIRCAPQAERNSQEARRMSVLAASWQSCVHSPSCMSCLSYQTFSQSGQGRISGPQQHVAVPRPEESLQKGKVCLTLSAHERYTALSQRTLYLVLTRCILDVEVTCPNSLSNGSNWKGGIDDEAEETSHQVSPGHTPRPRNFLDWTDPHS